MGQDFIDWLRANETEEEKTHQTGAGLLLAPINLDQPNESNEKLENDDVSILDEIVQQEEKEEENESGSELELPIEISEQIQNIQETIESLENVSQIPISESESESEIESEPQEQVLDSVQEEKIEEPTEILPPEFNDPDVNINKAWQERATGFELSLDEPPPEIWTRINESSSEYEDDEEVDYEQGVSLQDAAYVQKREHGKNFTERLQHTLKGRKQRAELLREEEESKKPHHPYIRKTVRICVALLITLGLVCLALWFIQRWTPDKMNERALNLYEQGKYDEAMNLYQNAYKRYPNVLTFLTGLAESAEKAGHVQTAKAAWNEYLHFLPDKDIEHKQHAENELKRLNGDEDKTEEPAKEESQAPKQEPEQESKQETEAESHDIKLQLPSKPSIVPVTFDEFLKEGNNAFNKGMYNVAIIYFFRALELNGSDVRAYIGLAESYRAKKMYFDSMRIIIEARKKFKRNPTIEMIAKYIKEAN